MNSPLLHKSSSVTYHAFGMEMPGRKWTASDYRFGYNGKENDKEVNGSGNVVNYGFRIHDARLGRFLSVDPLTKEYPWYTPYQFSGNTPIQAIDRDGLEPAYTQNRVGNNFVGQIIVLGSSTIQKKLPENAKILHGNAPAESPKLNAFSQAAVDILVPIGNDINTLIGAGEKKTTIEKISAAANLLLLGTGGKGKGGGRGANRLRPYAPELPGEGPAGSHTSLKYGKDGKITNYAEYKVNPENPTGFDEVKRVDLEGRPDFNKKTGELIETPHVHDKTIPDNVRPANPEEIPKNSNANPKNNSNSGNNPPNTNQKKQ